MNPRFEPIEHTADIGLRVWGAELPELFQNAALGMFHFVSDPKDIRELSARGMRLQADDLAGLLVEWLSELNFQHEMHDELYARARIDSLDAQACTLVGSALGERFDAARHSIHTEIKAVTFHDLLLEECPGGWQARVIFDV